MSDDMVVVPLPYLVAAGKALNQWADAIVAAYLDSDAAKERLAEALHVAGWPGGDPFDACPSRAAHAAHAARILAAWWME